MSLEEAAKTAPAAAATIPAKPRRQLDRSIVEGPIGRAVWKIAWPTVLQNAIGGLQGIIDHALVGHFVGFTGNAAIGVSWQIFLVVIVFISSLFTGMGVLVSRFAGANDHERVASPAEPHTGNVANRLSMATSGRCSATNSMSSAALTLST